MFMKKNSTLLLIVAATIAMSFSVKAQVLNSDIPLPENEIGEIIDNPIILQVQNPLKSEVLKRAKNAIGAEKKLVTTAEYRYDKYGAPTNKTTYEYDSRGNLVLEKNYIINDHSQLWMEGREEWICSGSYKYEINSNDQTTNEEYFNLDYSTGINSGYKYTYDYKPNGDIHNEDYEFHNNGWHLNFKSEYTPQGLYTNYESYTWDETAKKMLGNTKYSYTLNIVNGNYERERFSWNWDTEKNEWKINTNSKLVATYNYNNSMLFLINSKTYELINGQYVLTAETNQDPLYLAKNYNNSITKQLIGNVWVNQDRTIRTFDNKNNILNVEYSKWLDNQWKLSYTDVYTYIPDSTTTQIQYRTPIYYQVNNLTLPLMCSGQTMYPYRKYITQKHPVSGVSIASYNYSWDNNQCYWKPSSSKRISVYSTDGKSQLSYLYCPSYNTTDWTNCQFRTNKYNSKGRVIETIDFQEYNGETYKNKTENEYLSDTLLYRSYYYQNQDLNGDNIKGDDEWASDGYTIYDLKYNISYTDDSVHLTTIGYNDLKFYDLSKVKKLKVSGMISCNDLYEINRYSYDSLEVLDLSDALLKNNTLTDSCMGDTELQTLILPKTLKVIDEEAIQSDPYEEKYLRNLVIYPSIQVIHPLGLAIGKVDNVTIPSKFFKNLFESGELIDIPGYKDIFKSSLKTVTFNDLSGKIEDAVCYNMPYLQKATILDGTTEIGNNAFKSCGMLREINLPITTLQKIGYNAFWGCNELTTLTLPEGLNTIDYSAFWGCSGVTSISMPSSLTNIAQNAFWGCSGVNSMKVASQTPPTLGNNALQGVPRDASVEVPEIGFTAYKAAPQWKEFFNMKTSLSETEKTGVIISSLNGKLILQNLPINATIQVYTTTGSKIFDINESSINETITLNKGVYLLRINNEHFKTIIN